MEDATAGEKDDKKDREFSTSGSIDGGVKQGGWEKISVTRRERGTKRKTGADCDGMKACHAAILQQTETPKAAIVVQIWQGLSLTMNKTLPGEAMDEDVRGGNVAITARPCHTTSTSITTEENELRYE